MIQKKQIKKLSLNLSLLFGMLLVGLIIVTVFSAIKASTQGLTLLHLEGEAKSLELQNQELRDDLVSNTSMVKIAQDAQKLNMAKPQNITYLAKDDTQVAKLP